jgi:hypothetical protein
MKGLHMGSWSVTDTGDELALSFALGSSESKCLIESVEILSRFGDESNLMFLKWQTIVSVQALAMNRLQNLRNYIRASDTKSSDASSNLSRLENLC